MISQTPGTAGAISVAKVIGHTVAVALIAASVVWVASSGPSRALEGLPGKLAPLQPLLVSSPAPDSTVVCQGPLLGFVGQETEPRGFGQPDVFTMGASAEQLPITSEPLQDVLAGSEGAVAADPVAYRQIAEAGFLDASTSQAIDTPFARGFAAAGCHAPRSESWLVAGSTTTGRQAVLSLINPGVVAATVDLTVFGSNGEISAPSARGILLQPGQRRVVSVSGLAPNEVAPVIRVHSLGTAVSASIHSTVTRGLQPDGLDIAVSQEPPSTTRIIPGLWLETAEQLALVTAQDGYEDIGPSLRLLSPDADAQVTLSVVRPGLGGRSSQVSLQAGRVLDVAIDQLGQGNAAITISSDQPVVAGMRHSSVAEGQTDVAWIASAPVFTGLASVVIPTGAPAQLHLVNVADQPVSVRYARVLADGATALSSGEVSVDPGELSVVPWPSDGGNIVFESDGPVAIGVLLEGDGAIANLVANPPPPAPPNVSIYTR